MLHTRLSKQFTKTQINQALYLKPDYYDANKTIKEASLWRDGHETVCEQLTVFYRDGSSKTYYGYDAITILEESGGLTVNKQTK